MRRKPLLDGCHNLLLVLFGLLRKGKQRCQFRITGEERLTGRRIHPEDSVVPFTVAKGVLDNRLGFADAAYSDLRKE